MNERSKQYLRDAFTEADNLTLDLEGLDLQLFVQSRQLRRSTERSLEIIGESLRRAMDAHPELRESHSEFREWVALRNVLSHQYERIRSEPLWQAATQDLAELITLLKALLADSSE